MLKILINAELLETLVCITNKYLYNQTHFFTIQRTILNFKILPSVVILKTPFAQLTILPPETLGMETITAARLGRALYIHISEPYGENYTIAGTFIIFGPPDVCLT